MNVACPECGSVYRLDPAKVPAGGARTRCRECDTPFLVEAAAAAGPGELAVGGRVAEPATPAGATGSASAAGEPAWPIPSGPPVFGPQDPEVRAGRLARALVSDIKVYNRERWEQSRAAGTLRKDFRDEIVQSWEEYLEQVGETMAKRTPFFRQALNDILADGERVF
jgi:predicted Zn finger-like uncharacterized protein